MSNVDTAARQRIAAAYDPQLFKSLGTRFAELVGQHLEEVQHSQHPVLNWNEPFKLMAEAQGTYSGSRINVPTPERFGELVRLALSRGHNLHDPRYVGHQVPASVPFAGLFDAIGSVTNQPMAIYEMGPWATAVEQALVRDLLQLVGWTSQVSAGIVTHGASLANLTALLVARNLTLPESWRQGVPRSGPLPALVVQADGHYCLARSAGILGLGTDQVIKAALDDRRRMDPVQLDATLADLRRQGRPVIAVAACACATPIGAFDPLEPIAEVCQRHGVWLHVDAAHGGATLFSEKHRHLVAGIEQADSFTCDAHKMLFVPALCAFLFYKNKQQSFAAFEQHAPYLFDPTAPELAEFDSGLRTVECTKRAATFGLWGVWAMCGSQLFADLVDVTFDLTQQFHGLLTDAPDFEPLHQPECNILVFRHIPPELRDAPPRVLGDFQLRLRRKVIESGVSYLVPTAFNGVPALRVTLINPLTTVGHLQDLMVTLRSEGRQLLL